MLATTELSSAVGTGLACGAFGVPLASYHRRRKPKPLVWQSLKPRRSPRRLTAEERGAVLAALNSERFADCSPSQVYATLLDEGVYLASVRTMYRLLAVDGQTRERRNQCTHRVYTKPELLATGPNEVWSWDITKIKGPAKWTCFHLYVILDIFSRHVVGWMIAERESAELAEQLIADSVSRHAVEPGRLTLHTDRGASMRFLSQWPPCWWSWTLRRVTVGPTSRTTTRTRSRSSRR